MHRHHARTVGRPAPLTGPCPSAEPPQDEKGERAPERGIGEEGQGVEAVSREPYLEHVGGAHDRHTCVVAHEDERPTRGGNAAPGLATQYLGVHGGGFALTDEGRKEGEDDTQHERAQEARQSLSKARSRRFGHTPSVEDEHRDGQRSGHHPSRYIATAMSAYEQLGDGPDCSLSGLADQTRLGGIVSVAVVADRRGAAVGSPIRC